MPSDLTERLAAKLKGIAAPYNNCGCADCLAEWLPVVLPFLLSEPELVAGLPDAVRLSVLTPRERAVMRHGEAVYAHNVLLRERWNDHTALEESDEEIRSSLRALQQLAHDKDTNPEVPRG